MMKKQVFILLVALLAMWQSAFAYDFSAVAPSGQTLYYNIVNGSAEVTYQSSGYPSYSTYPSGTLTIPSSVTHDGTSYAVTSIGNYAFQGCDRLTSVTIPNSVTSIGHVAFNGCDSLTSVTIGNSVTSIGYAAFASCRSLTSVNIPNSVTSIGELAFLSCSALTSITIPDGVTSIGKGTFYMCSGLISVTIGNSVTSIDSIAFYGCSGLTSINYTGTVAQWCNIEFSDSYSNPTYYAHSLSNNGSPITNLIIPNGVTEIKQYAFIKCTNLTTVTIPNSVTLIDSSAFAYCSGLTSVNYAGTVAQWCNIEFSDYYSNPTYYAHSLSNNGSPITNLIIPNGVTEIKQYAFYYCSGLTSVTIPNSATSIGKSAFGRCNGLSTVTIPNNVTTIGNEAFGYCNSLDTVFMMPLEAPSLGSYVFVGNASGRVFVLSDCSSYDNYYDNSSWSSYRSYLRVPIIDLTFNLLTNDSTYGAANVIPDRGNRNIRCDSTAVIEATANYGYHFDHWSNGSTVNPDTINLVGDSTVIAYFSKNQYTVVLESGDTNLGTVSGDGVYYYLDTATLSATGINHNHFVRWSDGNRDNPRRYVITSNTTLTAYFAIDTFTVTVEPNDISRGMVEATGTEFVYGTPCKVTATPYSGYIFAGWSDGTRHNPYAFAVVSDTMLTARFLTEEEYEGIDDVIAIDVQIYQRDGKIVVEGTTDEVHVFDMMGRKVNEEMKIEKGEIVFGVPASGVYLVKVGDTPARRVVVIR